MQQPIIQLQHIHFRWPRQHHDTLAIDHLNIQSGEHLFIKGASGSGKTTLLNLLTGILVPQSGQLTVLAQPLTTLNIGQRDRFRADHMGVIFQQFNLLPYLSVQDNIQLPCRFSKHRAARAGNLQHTTMHLITQLGLKAEWLHRSVTDLSVGQQQRVAVARALIGKPELIIADEPTSALDTETRDAFLKLLFHQAEAQHSTVIFVSHDPHIAPYFPRVVDLQTLNQAAIPPEGEKV